MKHKNANQNKYRINSGDIVDNFVGIVSEKEKFLQRTTKHNKLFIYILLKIVQPALMQNKQHFLNAIGFEINIFERLQ